VKFQQPITLWMSDPNQGREGDRLRTAVRAGLRKNAALFDEGRVLLSY
jgi:hypothetical protein